MSDYGFPWDSENIGTEEKPILDRAYEAEQLQGVFKRFFSNGIFLDSDDALQTVHSVLEPFNEVNVWVKGGWCHINGVFKHFTESTPVTFEPLENPSAQSMRMDEVVLRWDAVARDIIIDVKKGVQAETTNPMPPALTRNELVWELGIALVRQGVGVFDVLDNRLSLTDCGIVAPFESIDTSSLLAQLQNAMDATVEAYEDAIDGTLAGSLQSQIDKTPQAGFEGTVGNRTYFTSQKRDEDNRLYSVIATAGGEMIFRSQLPNEPVVDSWRMNCKTLGGLRSGRQSISFSASESSKTVTVSVAGMKASSVVTASIIGTYPENASVSILRVESGSFTAAIENSLPSSNTVTLSWIAIL